VEVKVLKNPVAISALHVIVGAFLFLVASSQAASAQAGDAPSPAVVGLVGNHASLSVEDMDRETAWYGKVFGFKVTFEDFTDPNFHYRFLTIPGYRIDLIKQTGSIKVPFTMPRYMQQGWVHVCFTVPDLATAEKGLKAVKADVSEEKDEKGTLLRLVVHDPEGNEFELAAR
jgi:catechol 2,3-dioxygenase-like lactoylglutathione lyase family enzyme